MNQSSQANITVPVVVGGLVGAVMAVVPPCCCLCCLNALVAGAIAGGMFARAAGFTPIERGALIGSLAGALAGAGRSVLEALSNAALGPWVDGWMEQVARYGDAEARELIEQLSAFEGGGGPGWFLAGLVTSVGVGAVLGALGGMLGVALMRRQAPAASAGPVPPTPPPAAPPPIPPFPPPLHTGPETLPSTDAPGESSPPSTSPARESRIAGGAAPPTPTQPPGEGEEPPRGGAP
ncbi:MAG: hypothetical protein MUE47_00265 [Acidobacteria bacterium]|jgi:hypothetical protein|nr:hypothetical protein [Acidobacteriota bacterium]